MQGCTDYYCIGLQPTKNRITRGLNQCGGYLFQAVGIQGRSGGSSAVLQPDAHRLALPSLACRLSLLCSLLHGCKVAAAEWRPISTPGRRRSSAQFRNPRVSPRKPRRLLLASLTRTVTRPTHVLRKYF